MNLLLKKHVNFENMLLMFLTFFRRRMPDSNQTLSQTEVDLDQNNEPQKSGRKLGRQVSVSPSQDIRTLVSITRKRDSQNYLSKILKIFVTYSLK